MEEVMTAIEKAIKRLVRPIWFFRLNQALKISEMRKNPVVISALHKALRENEPMYLAMWKETNRRVGDAVDDLHDLMDWLREGKHYEEADRLRTIMARLANAVPAIPDTQPLDENGKPYLIRDIARTYK